MAPIPQLKCFRSLVITALTLLSGLGCRTDTNISAAQRPGQPPMSSAGLDPLPTDAGSDGNFVPPPPMGITRFPDAGRQDTGPAPKKDEKCAAESAMAKQVAVDLLLLVDRSGSMGVTGGRVGATGKTKWEIAQSALTTFVNDPKSAGLGVGLQYFPMVTTCANDLDCGVMPNPFLPPVCSQQQACIGPTGLTMPLQLCGTRRLNICPFGSTCMPIGRCEDSGEICTTPGQPCPGGAATNLCTPTPMTCQESNISQCSVPAYEKLAVPIGELPAAAKAIARSLAATSPQGDTPTVPAAEAGLNQLRARLAANPDHHVALVLVTDGLPNSCNPMPIPYVTSLLDTAAKATPSIETYAIGVFGASDNPTAGTSTLTDWATAGGTMTPFVLSAGDDLNQKLLEALNQIRGSALPCEYTIPTPSKGTIDYKKVNVHVTGSGAGPMGADLGYVTGADKCDAVKGGWHYDVDPATGTPARVVMCESTCKKFKMDATANIELRFGCETVVIP